MKASACNVYLAIVAATLAMLFVTVHSAPMESEDEQPDNSLLAHPDGDMDVSVPWDVINTAALRRLLLQLDAERMGRVTRAWPRAVPRGWGMRRVLDGPGSPSIDNRQADKRQVRFRQCYFNPISCFRK